MDLSGHEGEIPMPITSTYVVHHHSTPPSTNSNNEDESSKKQLVVVGNSNSSSTSKLVRYRECLKNHAASMGGTVTDGCGEFMPSGEEGSLEALKCSACSCHRNFHRKEIEGEQPSSLYHYSSSSSYIKQAAAAAAAARYMPTPRPPPPPPALIMPLGAIHSSESTDEIEDGYGSFGVMRGSQFLPPNSSTDCGVKKRFRTKFTQEQKEKMLGFAERVGWKLQRQEEGSVQQLCQEIGVKRRVLKVWMHNNKQSLNKKDNMNSSNNSNSNSSNSTLQIQ